ncbi:SRPBCC family protein [Spirillospora sp. CA-255316]
MEREWVAEESVVVRARPEAVYAAVADPRRMTRWSPELFAVWIRRRRRVAAGDGAAGPGRAPGFGPGTTFTGFNRIGWRVWFTDARVTAAVPGENFAFRVSSFRVPVALWGYRVEDIGDGSTRLTEYWRDLRRDARGARFVSLLGRVFTGVPAERRAELNRQGMRATLERVRAALEGPADPGT